jgi:hypothetical protein
LTETNCLNYKNARKAMSKKALFIVLEDNSAKYFADYKEPLIFIKGYSRNQDGYGFITHIMEAIHPQIQNESIKRVPKMPTFDEYENLYDFINAYMDWIAEDEII